LEFESARGARLIRQEEPTKLFSILSSAKIPFPSANPLVSRALSAFELFLGAFIVIGHNVFHVVPNEVIVLSVLGLLSIRVRDGGLSTIGFKRPASWRSILIITLVAAAFRIVLGQFVIEPITGFSGRHRPRHNWQTRLPEMSKLHYWLYYWCGLSQRLVKKSHIEDICLRAQPMSGKDEQRLIGLGLCSFRFCLATAIIIKVHRESSIPELQD